MYLKLAKKLDLKHSYTYTGGNNGDNRCVNLMVGIFSQWMHIHQIIPLYTLNIYNFICHLHLSKTGGKKKKPESQPFLLLHEFLPITHSKGWRSFFFSSCAHESIPSYCLCYFSHHILFIIELKIQGLGENISVPPQKKLTYIVSNYTIAIFHTFYCFVFHSFCPIKSHLTTLTFTLSFVGFSSHLCWILPSGCGTVQ